MPVRKLALIAVVFFAFVQFSVAKDELPEIRYLGLHSKQAKVSVNRRSYKLSVGETIKGGVTLISATKAEAVLRVNDEVYRYVRGRKSGESLPSEIVLKRDSVGMFDVRGAVNGASVVFLVDTGATFVTLSGATAKRLKLKYSKRRVIELQTASRVEKAYLVKLDSVRVGGIVRLDVAAVITKGAHPSSPLLGNSFLSSIHIGQKDQYMLMRDTDE